MKNLFPLEVGLRWVFSQSPVVGPKVLKEWVFGCQHGSKRVKTNFFLPTLDPFRDVEQPGGADIAAPKSLTWLLAVGKYGCREVQVHPTECGKQLGRDPSKNGSPKSFVLKSFLATEHFGTSPFTPPLPLL